MLKIGQPQNLTHVGHLVQPPQAFEQGVGLLRGEVFLGQGAELVFHLGVR